MEVILVNARHVKAVPGHKTDARDRAWLAALLRHGRLKARVIPPRHMRDLRELTRYGASVLRDQSAVTNRLQQVIERGT
jgi:transposase